MSSSPILPRSDGSGEVCFVFPKHVLSINQKWRNIDAKELSEEHKYANASTNPIFPYFGAVSISVCARHGCDRAISAPDRPTFATSALPNLWKAWTQGEILPERKRVRFLVS